MSKDSAQAKTHSCQLIGTRISKTSMIYYEKEYDIEGWRGYTVTTRERERERERNVSLFTSVSKKE